MVTKMSAERIGHLVRNIDHLPLRTDHRGLVRFEHSQDLNYMSVIEKLKEMAVEAPKALQLRARFGYFGGEAQATMSTTIAITVFLTVALLILAVGIVPLFSTGGPNESLLTKSPAERISHLVPNIDYLPLRTDSQILVRFEHSPDVRYVSQRSTPSIYLPFSQNKNFIGREDKMETLEHKLFVEQDCQKIAVVGLGGVGKTQVALQYAYSVLEKHPDVSVFWIHALSLETFEQACREVASVLGILGVEDGKEDVKELVQRHLSAETAGKWMLVLDNADDVEILESESGLTLFTTRDKKTAYALAGNSMVDVEKMIPATASNLFRKMLTRNDLLYDGAVINELLEDLDCLPLAIIQAAAYISCNAVSVKEYLGLLRGTEQSLVYVMSEEMHDHTRYKQAASAVARTWLVSFDQIAREDAAAADILQYMSCIEWKAIPRSILPAIEPEARMATAIGTLWSYSFISRRNNSQTYDMHRLVHVAARVWVKQKGLMMETQKRALEHLSNIFPTAEHTNREVWREYIPHAARLRGAGGHGHAEVRGRLYRQVGKCLRVDGRIRDAVSWLEESRDLRISFPEDHAGRLLTQRELAIAYGKNGQVKEAVRLLEHVVAIHGRVPGEDHLDRLASQHVLASAYRDNGQVKEAVRLLEHVVAIQARVLGENHLDLLASQHSLAIAYRANGQVKESLLLLEQVVAIRERVQVEDHLDRLASQHELAIAYEADGQKREGLELLEHVLAIHKRVLAEEHPHRLSSQQNLARAYWANGQVKDAVRLLEHVVAIRERVQVEDHPDRLASQHDLARAYLANGQVKEAVRLLQKVVAIRERVLGEDHPDRLASQAVLASAYQANGQAKESLLLLEHVTAIHRRVLPEDHPDRLASQRLLAMSYTLNTQLNDAVRLLEHIVVIEERDLVQDHPDRLISRRTLAMAYMLNGRAKEAVRLLEHVVAIQERVLAEDHLDRLTSQHVLANAYWANGQVKDAVRLLEHVVAIHKRVLAEDHPDRLASQRTLARAYEAHRQLD
jgi:tetratricopeptide (TPR) repeat protein